MAVFESTYSAEQSEAVVFAYLDRNMTANRVCELAAAGELTGRDGTKLEAFEIPGNTVRSKARAAKRRRAGELRKGVTDIPHRDAIENLRRTMLAGCAEALDVEMAKRPSARDMERLRQIARATREAAAIPEKTDPAPAAPGAKVDGKRNGGETKANTTLGGGILAAHRARHEHGTMEPAPDAGPTHHASGTDSTSSDDGEARAAAASEQQQEHQDDGSPGALVRELAVRVGSPVV